MKRRDLIAILGGAAVAWPRAIRAQTTSHRPLIACLYSGRADTNEIYKAPFLDGMRDLGYVEGGNFEIVYRYAEGDYASLPALADGLIQLKPDLILAAEPPAAVAAKRATQSIPIVGALLADPVRQGLVASYARPGGNLTGILVAIDGLWNKYLELARELVPGATTIGLIVNPSNPGNAVPRHDVETAGAATGIKIVVVEARATVDFEPAFKALIAAGVQAVIVAGDALFVSEHTRLAELSTASRLPAVSGTRELTEAGGIVSYSVSNSGNYRRAAYFVDKILKGTKPADLPVEFPTKLEMIVNMKAAKALGITIAPSLLATADEVIE